jgi:hypothetical protein
MKTVKIVLALTMVLAMAVVAGARDKEKGGEEEVTLKGEFACAKCVLKMDKSVTKGKCTNAITVKKGDKEVVYLLDDQGGKEPYHKAICQGTKTGTVKGMVTKKGDQMYIKPSAGGVMMDKD